MTPARGRLGRIRDRTIGSLITTSVAGVMLPPLNMVRAGIGVPPLRAVDDLFSKAPLTLYLTAEPFEYHRSHWPASIVMVGPCAWEPPIDPPDWLTRIEEPIVLVTTSSEFQDDGRLVRIALEALAEEPVHVVATMPTGVPTNFAIPSNAHLKRFVAHTAVLQHATCAITHGGMGATQKALTYAVPVCAVPFGRDQLEVARRVEVAEAGTRVSAKRLDRDRLRTAVRHASTQRAGAQRVAAGFAAAGGPAAAADAIEQRLLHHEESPAPPRDTT